MVLMPGLSVLLSFQRAILVNARHTTPATWATMMEVGGIILVMFFAIIYLDLVGAVAATLALMIGRLAANIYLVFPFVEAKRLK